MIIRKPYAFLIKNFRKIHIFLLLLSLFVAYMLIDVNSFVSEFMRIEVYDAYRNPISHHITIFLLLAILLLVIGCAALLFLLIHKKKPWKVYLLPLIEYLVLFFVLMMIRNFFIGYTYDINSADLRMSRDLLVIFLLGQIPTIGIFIMRIFGLDINKFQFNIDEEFLELSEEDREEVEIGLNIDKNSFIRFYKRNVRYFKYFYLEHKRICLTILFAVLAVCCYRLYVFIFIVNRSYSEGDVYHANGYTFIVNDVYYTDKDYKGNVVENGSSFVVVNLTMRNNSSPRTIYLENFHLKNSDLDYVTTRKTYAKEFQDLGDAYESTSKLQKDEVLNCIIIYKVPRELKKNKFVLYYQEKGGYLRKIKLKVKDLSVISNSVELKMGDEMPLGIQSKDDTIVFDYYEVTDSVDYTVKECRNGNCVYRKYDFNADGDYKILKIEFSSDVYEAKNMIDFLKNYGKLIYKDSNDDDEVVEYVNPIGKNYCGKNIFMKVPVELESSGDIRFEFSIRDKKYIYKIA